MISREDLNALHESKESVIKNAEYDISYWFDDVIENELYSKAIFGNDDPLPVTFEIDNATDKDVPVLIVNGNNYIEEGASSSRKSPPLLRILGIQASSTPLLRPVKGR